MKKRIYVVTAGTDQRLVSAANRQQAVAHVARSTIGCEVASQMDLVAMVGNGVKLEQASPEGQEQLPIAGLDNVEMAGDLTQ